MENGQIKNHQISASSQYSSKYPPVKGRLNLDGTWANYGTDHYPWFQVDFIENTTLTAISIQSQPGSSYFVETYTVSYSNNGTNFQFYTEDGQAKVAISTSFK